ncbi:MAG TPA: MotA/TolQ/ExbB proton channel family protein [Solimonas sp.]|nr:MotA/TolQ/ExbB proton channel family protein [Solimonas sp.]
MLWDWLRLGGPAMWVLFGLWLAALTLVTVKCWEFWELRLLRRDFVPRALALWRAGQAEQAQALLAAEPGPLAQVLAQALRVLGEPGVGEAQARERIAAAAQARLESLRSFFRPLEVISQIAPLLGLLGTVLGMIDAFQALQAAGSAADPALLSAGIWEALLTTAAGLVIAIPVIAVLNAFERLVDGQQLAMEQALTELLTQPLPAVDRAPRRLHAT